MPPAGPTVGRRVIRESGAIVDSVVIVATMNLSSMVYDARQVVGACWRAVAAPDFARTPLSANLQVRRLRP